jgi:pSer/pThr/pTyr-binding forkhead associated (FHA) protein
MTQYCLYYEQERIPVRQGETTLGRSPYCSVVLTSPTVSRQHAALTLEGSQLTVGDLGSRNGTRVNGSLITDRTRLKPGDLITIGSCRLEIGEERQSSTSADNTEERPLSEPPDSTLLGKTLDFISRPVTTCPPSTRDD